MTRTDDPYSDSYQPPAYDAYDSRHTGSGRDFGADLFSLYRAGRTELPAKAAVYSAVTSAAFEARGDILGLADTAGVNHEVVGGVLGLCAELQGALRRTTLALRDTGEALVRIADDYVTTDQQARDQFRELLRSSGIRSLPLPDVPPPPPVGDLG